MTRHHIEVQQGDDRPIRIPVTSTENGQPVNITGWPVRALLRRSGRSREVVHVWSSEDGNAVAEQDTVLLLCDDSSSWDFRGGVFNIVLTHPDGATTVTPAWSLHVLRTVS